MKLSRLTQLMLVAVLALSVAACGQPSAQQELESAVEATVEQTQTDVDTIFADLDTAVNDALEKVGNLPSQQDEAASITSDLDDISSRIDDAINAGGDDQLETFENLGNAFDAVINNVNNLADGASGEQQVAIKELSVVLVGAREMLGESIRNMMGVEAKATVVEVKVEAAEAEATEEVEAAEAEETAVSEAADAEATAAAGEAEAVATAETDEVDAEATAVAEEEEAAADIVDTAVAAGDFTTLVAAVEAAGLVDTLKSEGPYTVFAPTYEAFAALPAGTVESLLADPEGALTDILLYHVIAGKVMAAHAIALDGQEVEMVSGAMLPISVDGENVMVGDAVVIVADIETSNGVIHVIDAVLIPPTE